MLWFVGSQRVGHEGATELTKCVKSWFGLGEQTTKGNPKQLNLLILKPSVCSALSSLLTLLSAGLSIGHSSRFVYLFNGWQNEKNERN